MPSSSNGRTPSRWRSISYGQGIPASYPACNTLGQDLTAAGIDVSYEDLDASLGGNFTSAAQQIAAHHSDFLVSCIEDSDDISLTRALQQYGVHIDQLWLNGYNQALLDQYQSLMQGVYIDANGFVPFAAPALFPGAYPGMEQYLTVMRKYEPSDVTNQLAMQGWQSAALFTEGLKLAGSNPTPQAVIAPTNRLTGFTAGGVSAPVNWTTAHTTQSFPICPSFVQVKGAKFVPVTSTGHQVFICFGQHTNLKDPVPVTPRREHLAPEAPSSVRSAGLPDDVGRRTDVGRVHRGDAGATRVSRRFARTSEVPMLATDGVGGGIPIDRAKATL